MLDIYFYGLMFFALVVVVGFLLAMFWCFCRARKVNKISKKTKLMNEDATYGSTEQDDRYHELDEFAPKHKKKPPVAKAQRGKQVGTRHIDPLGQMLEDQLEGNSEYFASSSVRGGPPISQYQGRPTQARPQAARSAPPRFVDPVSRSIEDELGDNDKFAHKEVKKKKKGGIKLFKK